MNEVNRKTLGKNIRRRRKDLDMTLNDVHKKVNVSIAFLAAAERGESAPSLDTTAKVAKVLGTTVDKLLKGCDLSEKTS